MKGFIILLVLITGVSCIRLDKDKKSTLKDSRGGGTSEAAEALIDRAKDIKDDLDLEGYSPEKAGIPVSLTNDSIKNLKSKNRCWRENIRDVYLPQNASDEVAFGELAYCLFWHRQLGYGVKVGIRDGYIGKSHQGRFVIDRSQFDHTAKKVYNIVASLRQKGISTYRDFLAVPSNSPLSVSKNGKIEVPYNIGDDSLIQFMRLYPSYPIKFILNRPTDNFNTEAINGYHQKMAVALNVISEALTEVEGKLGKYVPFKFLIGPTSIVKMVRYRKMDRRVVQVELPYNVSKKELVLMLVNHLDTRGYFLIPEQKPKNTAGFITMVKIKGNPSNGLDSYFNTLERAYGEGIANTNTAIKGMFNYFDQGHDYYVPEFNFIPFVFSIGPKSYMPLSGFRKLLGKRRLYIEFPYDLPANDILLIARNKLRGLKFTYSLKSDKKPGISKEEYLKGIRTIERTITKLPRSIYDDAISYITFRIGPSYFYPAVSNKQVKFPNFKTKGNIITIPNDISSGDLLRFLRLYHAGYKVLWHKDVGGVKNFLQGLTTFFDVVEHFENSSHSELAAFKRKFKMFQNRESDFQLEISDTEVFRVPFTATKEEMIRFLSRY